MPQSLAPSKKTRFGSRLMLSLFTLSLSACGAGPESSESEPLPATEVGSEVGSNDSQLLTARVRLMAANISSGNYQSYDPGHGTRIFQGTKPDVVMIQEFNYGDNSATAIRSFVNTAFGSTFSYYREAGAQIPNGVISRWPIVASGEWDDPYVTNRDFAWARIDIPGPKDLWVVSVHLLTRSSSVRNTEAVNLVNYIKANVPAGDYLAIGGDFNTDSRTESCFGTFSQVVTTNGPHPADKNGNAGTNASREKPYDHVLVDADLRPALAVVVEARAERRVDEAPDGGGRVVAVVELLEHHHVRLGALHDAGAVARVVALQVAAGDVGGHQPQPELPERGPASGQLLVRGLLPRVHGGALTARGEHQGEQWNQKPGARARALRGGVGLSHRKHFLPTRCGRWGGTRPPSSQPHGEIPAGAAARADSATKR